MQPGPPTIAGDLEAELQAETRALLQRRFVLFAGAMCALGLGVLLIVGIVAGIVAADARGTGVEIRRLLSGGAFAIVALVLYSTFYFLVRHERFSPAWLLRLSFAMVILDGVLKLLPQSPLLGPAGIALTHLLACAILPWTPVQSMFPVAALWVLSVLLLIARPEEASRTLGATLAFPLIGLPGLVVCWLRLRRRLELVQLRFFQRRYGEVRRELTDARRIHESLFPGEISDGPVRLRYRYEPMQIIGGDFLFTFRESENADCPLSVVLLDVTGHGISAALTVNRLYGELQRLFAEEPGLRPGGLLSLLNRYVHLTLARHSMYVTALAARIDPRERTIEYANAGHPPAYLCCADGTVQELPASTVLLGALADVEFSNRAIVLGIRPGDALVAFTDGAIEARNRQGRMFGLKGIRNAISTIKPGDHWTDRLVERVDAHRDGPPSDDTLVLELHFAG